LRLKGTLAINPQRRPLAAQIPHPVNGLNIARMSTPGEDNIQKTYHGAKDGWLEEAVKAKPFGRLIDPKEVARACAYLCSDESGLMTGSNIDFDQNVVGTSDPPLEP
jgi:NAD(P)-dependent dehydrogenase (short-subunit alcohol dehydrogenase family)